MYSTLLTLAIKACAVVNSSLFSSKYFYFYNVKVDAKASSNFPDPSLPPVRNRGQQQIRSSLDFSLSSSQQDLNLGTPEDAALLHTNYRVPSVTSHLSNSCIAAITNGEYVDLASLLPFSSLLRDHVTANSQLKLQVGNEGLTIPLPSQAKRPKITGIDRWLDAFAIYSSVLLSSYPSRGVDLFAYQQLIRQSARKFPGMAWYLYDMEFRQRASHNLSINRVKGMFSCT